MQTLQKESGFVDVDQIQEDAWPALMADLTVAKPSIIASAFGMLSFYLPLSFQGKRESKNQHSAISTEILQTEWASFSEEMMALKFLDEYFILNSMP